ncbi:Trypsin-like peptidase domain-containing protein [Nitrosomonas cryotolerans]|uniref:Trypsin-like peptidase domain-containing protein n=1 Tax=Nitrosomonas cryotolerans ATCC 49181 TaxID=1131553 RepID=A0A1N6JBA7_9PROT|nr:Trypsin-like peptidase domain-containing protein [Nitrosomonas cryotolerans]SIO41570.1 Trypsin-like peptidase domain-containing protein [Nitrosomonas cryotolerans ATCC 49181]
MKNISLVNGWRVCVMFSLCFMKQTAFLGLLSLTSLSHAQLVQTIKQIKPAIVGIGSYQKMRAPPVNFLGTGFVVGDGIHVVTNAHVVPNNLDRERMESYVVITGKGENPGLRTATIVALDKEHDLALLRIEGTALPAMKLGDADMIREGRMMAYTGFPIGMVLGFYPVTHQAIISSITPIILPAHNSRQLDATMIKQLKKSPFMVFQLDGIAYPGSSGSPLYDSETGLVYGIVNMVFVKNKKESALSNPSGISYAIPGNYIKDLLSRQRL